MIFNSNLQQCKWSRCDKGVYRGYHTPVEWTQHEQYVKIDLPPPIYPVQFTVMDNDGAQSTSPAPQERSYPMHNPDRKWQYAAVGTMVAVWGIVIWSVISLL